MDEDDIAPDVGEESIAAPEPQAEPESQPEAPPSVEALASEMGWTPQDQWKGAPDKWKPAHEFMRTTVDVNRGLSKQLKGVEQRLDVLARTSATITEQQLAKQREELLAAREEAKESFDFDGYEKANKALERLPDVPTATPPEVEDFQKRNEAWLGKDEEATRFAYQRCDELARQGLSAARQLMIVEREMKQYFPDVMPAEAPKPKPAPLNKPGSRGSAPASQTYASLPDEAKKAASMFVSNGTFKSVDDYAKVYFEELGR